MKRTVFLVLMNFLAQAISGIALNAQSCGTFAQIVYVNSDAQGANNGTSWANAFTKLQDALAIACSCSQVNQVWVAAGTYYPDEGNGQSNNNRSSSFYMCNQVAIYGGFAGTETDINQRDWQQHVTMLSGEDRKSTRLNSSHVKISYAAFCLKKKRKWSWSAASTDSIA